MSPRFHRKPPPVSADLESARYSRPGEMARNPLQFERLKLDFERLPE